MTPEARAVLLELEAAGVRIELVDGSLKLSRTSELTPKLHVRVAAAKRLLVEHLSLTTAPSNTAVFTFRPVAPIVVSFSTRSPISIHDLGARVYAQHPRLEVLGCVLMLRDGSFLECDPSKPLPRVVADDLGKSGGGILAFSDEDVERFIWERLGWPNFPWANGAALARVLGRQASLDGAARDVLGIARTKPARDVLASVSRLDRAGQYRAITRGEREAIVNQARVDALTARRVWDGGVDSALLIEPRVRELHARINERGFAFDSGLANAVLRIEAQLARDARVGAVAQEAVGSSYGMKRFLGRAGIPVDSLRRDGLALLLDDVDLPDYVRATITAHLAAEGIVSHKLRAAHRRVGIDGRLRDSLVYYAAHTGRWAGRGFQPQNLPRGAAFQDDAQLEQVVAAALCGNVELMEKLSATRGTSVQALCASLVRACVRAPAGRLLAVVDYAQIEPRILAWLAGDHAALARFADGNDPYIAMAAKLFGIEETNVDRLMRALGKALVLGCGYQMGAGRFEEYARAFGVDWSSIPISPQDAVGAWRAANPRIAGDAGLWAWIEEAAFRAAHGESYPFGPLRWERRGEDVVCVLPSRRPLIYRRARVELRLAPWGDIVPTFTYERHGARVHSYGGKLTENVTQAIARDVLAQSMLDLEEAELEVVLHVHDETVSEIQHPDEIEQIESIMCGAPAWAPGLPLATAGHVGLRYRK